MARKKAQKQKQETTLVPHRTLNLSVLLERAKSGDSARAVKAYLDAGGSTDALLHGRGAIAKHQIPLLHYMTLFNAHPHRELAESVRLLIEAGADINIRGPDQRTVLAVLCETGCCIKGVRILLQHGADVSLATTKGQTALHFAASTGRTDCCELLLARDKSLVHVTDVKGYTPLLYAAHDGHLDVAKLLLRHGADVHAVNCDGMCSLLAAACENHAAVLQLLLDHGADISVVDYAGQNALLKATDEGHVSMMELLFQHGVSVTAVDSEGTTPLLLAAQRGHKPAAEWLLQHGVAVDATVQQGSTALHIASARSGCDDAAMIELLLAGGADVHRRTDHGKTALDMAATYGNTECAKVLIAAGVAVNSVDSRGRTSLHLAVIEDNSAVAQLLLEHGATAVINRVLPLRCSLSNACCCTGLTALMMCTTVDTAKVLLAAGADVHVTTYAGDTCLHLAVRHELPVPLVCLMIKAGADLHAVNNEGLTPVQVAHSKGCTLVEQLLSRAAQQAH
jgi:ankyrin repeat protein